MRNLSEIARVTWSISASRVNNIAKSKLMAHLSKQEVADLSDSIFSMNEAIRYVAVLDSSNRLLESGSKKSSLREIPVELLREFVSFGPLIALGDMERLHPFSGRLEYVVTRYEKHFVVICNLQNHFVVLVLDSKVEIRVVEDICNAVSDLLKDHIR